MIVFNTDGFRKLHSHSLSTTLFKSISGHLAKNNLLFYLFFVLVEIHRIGIIFSDKAVALQGCQSKYSCGITRMNKFPLFNLEAFQDCMRFPSERQRSWLFSPINLFYNKRYRNSHWNIFCEMNRSQMCPGALSLNHKIAIWCSVESWFCANFLLNDIFQCKRHLRALEGALKVWNWNLCLSKTPKNDISCPETACHFLWKWHENLNWEGMKRFFWLSLQAPVINKFAVFPFWFYIYPNRTEKETRAADSCSGLKGRSLQILKPLKPLLLLSA